jgi:hypothetical protein
MLMHVYRLNIFTNNIDKYNQGQGHYNSNVRKNLVVDMIEIREIDNNIGSSLFH